MTINNNIQTYNNGYVNKNDSLERIATGLKLNQASDNAASVAISENLKVQSNGIAQSIENVNSAVASAQISDRAISDQSQILDNIREKLLQASTDTTSEDGRKAILKDIQKSLTQFNNIAEQTNYNGENLLQAGPNDSSASNSLQYQAGENSNDIIELSEIQSNTTGTGLDALLNQDPNTFNADTARDYLHNVDNAIDTLNNYRGEIGSTVNQLESSNRNLAEQFNGTQEAESLLSNVNFANEVTDFSKQNILAQVGAIAVAQSNNITQQSVSRLLQ